MKKINILLILFATLLTSCLDPIEIDPQDGPKLIGINGHITNEYKKHQIVISKTTDFYSDSEAEMVSDAEVFIYDGFDTIRFKETENQGYYETIDSVAGVIGRTYNLHVKMIGEDGEQSFYAQSTMRDNVEKIDSLKIKEVILGEIDIPGTLGLYPYFLSLADPRTSYLINVAVNDTLKHQSLIRCQSFSLAGLSGAYLNSPEMVALVGEQPIYYFFGKMSINPETGSIEFKESLNKGDKITMFMYSITPDFSKYISDINSNFGSNPMMGMPYNVSTNIYPEGKAVGFFEATSVITSEVIY